MSIHILYTGPCQSFLNYYVLTENIIDILIAVSCKYLLHIPKNQFTSDFKIFS